ncbi:MAG: GAF domain-containing protein [Acholeplasmataceae bacterium]
MKELLLSANSLFEESKNNISLLSNASAFLNDTIPYINWVGFYLYENESLELGPFQGKTACVSIEVGKGVCGTAFLEEKILNIKDVHTFDGHIACDSASNSELVIPLIKEGIKIGVLDIDSPLYNRFDDDLVEYVKSISKLILSHYKL